MGGCVRDTCVEGEWEGVRGCVGEYETSWGYEWESAEGEQERRLGKLCPQPGGQLTSLGWGGPAMMYS